jgi:tRNA(adenine34) deaminase
MNSFMEEAIAEAKKALKKDEVPIGAVIVKNGRIIARGFNKREKSKNATNHAEIIAINRACKKLRDWHLVGCSIFVTLEPCPMCAGAIANARIEKVFFGAKDKTASDRLFEKILTSDRLNHKCEFEQLNDYESECANLLSQFFKEKRKHSK